MCPHLCPGQVLGAPVADMAGDRGKGSYRAGVGSQMAQIRVKELERAASLPGVP